MTAVQSHPRYRRDRLIATGGMGEVFRARHRKLDRIAAVKVISRQRLDNPIVAQRFRREAEAAAQLSHPNIVAVHDAGEAGDTFYLAMEYIDGLDLARLVAAGGEVLVVALHGGGERDAWSGRVADGAPRWPDSAFDELAALLGKLAVKAPDHLRVAFHPHTATWVEAPDEVDRLAERIAGSGAGLCLDVGHYTVGGGDPVEAIRRHGDLITHVHVKDVDGEVLERLRAGELEDFGRAVRERIFTEVGNGVLDVDGRVFEIPPKPGEVDDGRPRVRPVDFAFDVNISGGSMRPFGGQFDVSGIAGRLNDSHASALERYFWHATICAPPRPMSPCKCSPVAWLMDRACRLYQEPSLALSSKPSELAPCGGRAVCNQIPGANYKPLHHVE